MPDNLTLCSMQRLRELLQKEKQLESAKRTIAIYARFAADNLPEVQRRILDEALGNAAIEAGEKANA